MEESDLDFDSYWEEEARNPNRNRIRIGRQYQAQVPSLLQNPETNSRRTEDLETLTYAPNRLSDAQLDEYLAIAKSIGLFVQALDNAHEGVELDELPENLDELNSGFEIGAPTSADWSPSSAFDDSAETDSPKPPALLKREKKTSRAKKAAKSDCVNSEPESASHSPLKPYTNHKIKKTLQGLSSFIHAHRPQNESEECNSSEVSSATSIAGNTQVTPTTTTTTTSTTSATATIASTVTATTTATTKPTVGVDSTDTINLGSSANLSSKQLLRLVQGTWSSADAAIFARALQVCGKNFSAIKKDYLPWKAVRAIIEFYYLSLDKENEKLVEEQSKKSKSPKNKSPGKRFDRSSTDDSKSKSRKHDGSGNSRDHHDGETDRADEQNDVHEETGSTNDTDDKQSATQENRKNFSEPKASAAAAGQEIKALRAKPISTGENGNGENGVNGAGSSLGSLSLYLHGELVLKLNSQAQDGTASQKWVESNEALPKKKRASVTQTINGTATNGNGHSTHTKGAKRPLESRLSREDTDDRSSLGGGDVSGSDEDSRTSTDSISVIASSPSSSSTVTGSTKKARVRVENLPNGAPLSSPSGMGRRYSHDDERHKNLPGLSSLHLLGSLFEASGQSMAVANGNGVNGGGAESFQNLLNLAKAVKSEEINGHPSSTLNGSKPTFADIAGLLSPPLTGSGVSSLTASTTSPAACRQRSTLSAPPLCGSSTAPTAVTPFTAKAGGGATINNGRHFKKSSKNAK